MRFQLAVVQHAGPARPVGLSAMRPRTLTRHGGAARLSMDCSAPLTRTSVGGVALSLVALALKLEFGYAFWPTRS